VTTEETRIPHFLDDRTLHAGDVSDDEGGTVKWSSKAVAISLTTPPGRHEGDLVLVTHLVPSMTPSESAVAKTSASASSP